MAMGVSKLTMTLNNNHFLKSNAKAGYKRTTTKIKIK